MRSRSLLSRLLFLGLVCGATLRGVPAADAAIPGRNLAVVVVVDQALYVRLGSSESVARDFAIEVMNGVTPLTAPDLALRVQVVDVVVRTVSDGWTAFTVGSEVSSSSLLSNFRTWAAANLTTPQNDQAVLLSGRDFDGSTVGLATVGAACGPTSNRSAPIVQATFSAAYVSRIMAHEIGHTIGLAHDGSGNACPYSGFIMSPVGCETCVETRFSSCSVARFAQWFSSSGSCLLDGVPSCGNGVHQAGEQCDCGAECGTDPCCAPWWEAGGCQLEPGCGCAVSDGCCAAGAPAAAGTVCRVPAGDCDVVEQCDGASPYCPPDLHDPIGTACGTNGACGPAGACASLDAQCIALNGGPFAVQLVGECTQFPSTCSTLYCEVAGSGGGCTSFTIGLGLNLPPADGTPCGTGAVCSGGACVPISAADGCPADPSKTAEGICGCGVPDIDTDGDGLADCIDRCPLAGAEVSPGSLCAFWTTTPFSTCDAACGGGTQTRTVTCTDGATSLLDAACADAGTRPASEQACKTDPCPAPGQTLLGTKFLVKNPDPADATKRKVVVQAKETSSPNTLDGDPVVSGASLTVNVAGAVPSSQVLSLPAAGWAPVKDGFKYSDPKLALGPVKSAQIKLGRGTFQWQAVLAGKTGGLVLVPPNPGTDACVVFEITGGGRYHVLFPGPPDATIAKNDAKTFQVKKVLAEGLCP